MRARIKEAERSKQNGAAGSTDQIEGSDPQDLDDDFDEDEDPNGSPEDLEPELEGGGATRFSKQSGQQGKQGRDLTDLNECQDSDTIAEQKSSCGSLKKRERSSSGSGKCGRCTLQ